MANRAPSKINKTPISGNTLKAMKIVDEYVVPKSAADVAFLAVGGPGLRAIGGITKAGAKYVNKVYRNMTK
jgi:hypothetical protein